MNTLRLISNIGICSPAIWLIGALVIPVSAVAASHITEEARFGLAMVSAVVLAGPFAAVVFLFPIGVTLYGFLGIRSEVAPRWVWWAMLLSGIFWLVQSNIGIRFFGAFILFSMFVFDPFKYPKKTNFSTFKRNEK